MAVKTECVCVYVCSPHVFAVERYKAVYEQLYGGRIVKNYWWAVSWTGLSMDDSASDISIITYL